MPEKILIADDEQDVVTLLKDYFEINGYFVMTALSGSEAVRQSEKQPDLILLDINMPDLNGLSVCLKIREHVSCPILFLTARSDEADKITGFMAGGDDYIVKPFSIEELGARVKAHLRREHRQSVKNQKQFSGSLVIDYSAKEVTIQDKPIAFARKEFEIIELLSLNCGQVFDRERIYERLWGYDSEGDSSVIAEHVRRIRKKLSEAGAEPHLQTVWGIGYKWTK